MGALDQPIWLESEEIVISGTAGIAYFPDHADEAETLVRLADVALYQAKREGRGRARLFDPAMEREIALRNRLKGELRRAIERDEFTLLYQPQVDCETTDIVGLEALIRWRHPELGLLAPAEFIGVAEATGLIRPLGLWVLRTACRLARAWRERGRPIRVCVNLSAAQLRDPGFAEAVIRGLGEAGVLAADLELEITESLLVERADEATEANLRQLVAHGVRLALDDFGTGYSAMAQLTRLPVTTIKIDRSLLVGLQDGGQDAALVRAIVMLGRTLGKRVLAEGVETPQQLAFLRELRCDAAQGYLFGAPADAQDLWSTLGRRE
jgi:EAL domain-containing protein (putative c-di-GMP-specific phosphodiesterase class I)